MESPASVANASSPQALNYSYYRETRLSINAVAIEKSLGGNGEDSNEAGIDSVFKGLSVTADKIIKKINELLKAKVPNGVQTLKPEEVTPEATADKIVKGVTGLFETYKKQHADMDDEELLASFMEQVKSGVQQGYDEAYQALEGMGAFGFDGVKDGVQQTKALIGEKLAAWEKAMRKEMGLEGGEVAAAVSDDVSSSLLSQAGARVNTFA